MGLREAYQEKADAQLKEWQEWIKKYASDPSFSGTGGLPERQRMVERLQDCYRVARIRLDELRASQDEHWDFSKQAVERALIDLKKVLDESGAVNASRFLHLQRDSRYVDEPLFRRRG